MTSKTKNINADKSTHTQMDLCKNNDHFGSDQSRPFLDRHSKFLEIIHNMYNFLTSPGYVQDGIFCHFLASMFSGLVTTAASMPVDIAKTR